jgi:hypothetical protein
LACNQHKCHPERSRAAAITVEVNAPIEVPLDCARGRLFDSSSQEARTCVQDDNQRIVFGMPKLCARLNRVLWPRLARQRCYRFQLPGEHNPGAQRTHRYPRQNSQVEHPKQACASKKHVQREISADGIRRRMRQAAGPDASGSQTQPSEDDRQQHRTHREYDQAGVGIIGKGLAAKQHGEVPQRPDQSRYHCAQHRLLRKQTHLQIAAPAELFAKRTKRARNGEKG